MHLLDVISGFACDNYSQNMERSDLKKTLVRIHVQLHITGLHINEWLIWPLNNMTRFKNFFAIPVLCFEKISFPLQ